MNKLNLVFESSPWLIGVGALIGLVYAALLYAGTKAPWGKNNNYILAVLRFLMVTQLTLLLFGPLIRQEQNTKESPSIVIALDNSQSIAEIEDSTNLAIFRVQLDELQEKLSDKGYSTEIRTLQGQKQGNSPIRFNAISSNLNEMLRGIQNDYESRNLSTVLLFSDGLYNLGSNPAFHPYNFQISTIGLGDTTQRPDLNLNTILYNKIAYQGNKFPIVAELFSYNLAGKTIILRLEQNNAIIEQKQVKINNQNQFDQVQFLVEAKESGMKRYTVQALPVEGEFTLSNNVKEAFIDVIDGKQKVLLVAAAPHPDIKAIRSALESNDNYEVITHIKGINEFIDDKYDAVVLHQVPERRKKYTDLLNKITTEQIPALFIYGSQSDVNSFNQLNGTVSILPTSYQRDNAFPLFNIDFSKFIYENENVEALNNFPPVKVPFANFVLKPQSEVLLFQKVGKVATRKPLLIIQRSSAWSSAALLGEGIWSWRLQEYAKNQSHKAFDEMLSKIIQFISTKEDKRRFKVYSIKNEYLNNEVIVFENEIYNDIYEQTFGHKIDLRIRDEQNNIRSYSYVTSEKNSRYRISDLENGIYSYQASATINEKTETASGSFTVKDLQIETTKITADHNLLRNVALQNGGNFYGKNELDQLEKDILEQEMISKIYYSETYLAIINMKWGFFILILFISAEWFLRKFYGSY